eukprot:PhF_6_TR38871/c0_g1_i1/m.58130
MSDQVVKSASGTASPSVQQPPNPTAAVVKNESSTSLTSRIHVYRSVARRFTASCVFGSVVGFGLYYYFTKTLEHSWVQQEKALRNAFPQTQQQQPPHLDQTQVFVPPSRRTIFSAPPPTADVHPTTAPTATTFTDEILNDTFHKRVVEKAQAWWNDCVTETHATAVVFVEQMLEWHAKREQRRVVEAIEGYGYSIIKME